MPASPIGVKLKEYPSRWKWKQDVIIPDQGDSGTFFKIWYEEKGGAEKNDWYAWLMWCPSDELLDEHGEDNWHHVEELTIESIGVLNTIEMVLDISFHDRIIKELPSE
tara:strand:- start:20 stop:343 length:324 start_codon:yes stop_codon:yes gene_type:complete